VGPQYQLTFGYDAKSRRIQKVVATNGVAVATNKFLYDGWNLVAELGSSGTLVRSYTWGTDLSGSLQGAGGVGGLLAVSYYGTGTTNCFAAYDGNGNVAGLVNGADGTLAASYEYGPFGEVIRQTGPMAKVNPFRFSSKYQDEESDLLYYGYRYYKASTGTWPSRDPLGEEAFFVRKIHDKSATERSRLRLEALDCSANLYCFINNRPTGLIDLLGLAGIPDFLGPCCPTVKLVCRPIQTGNLGKAGFVHCYLSIRDLGGKEVNTISAFPDVPDHEGYTTYSADTDKGSGGKEYPLTVKGNSCSWLKCANDYANDYGNTTNGKTKYDSVSNNSNRFVTEVIRHCGGSANFPWGAWGSDDL